MACPAPEEDPLVTLALPIMRSRLTLRLLEETTLPPYKGALLRGGFGYAFQRASCPQPCWGASERCAVQALCPYRQIFETPHPPHVTQLHDLHDVPRPFVIEPPLDHKRQYAAGDALEPGLVLIGRGIDYLPYFLYSFENLGRMGLGRTHARFRLERVEALRPWQPTGSVIYQDGRVVQETGRQGDKETGRGGNKERDDSALPIYDAATITQRAAALPDALRLTLRTPLRVKHHGDWLRAIDMPAIVQSLCWRLNALATFHGGGPWPVDHRALVEQARSVAVEQQQVQWVDWERTSMRGEQPHAMKLGGIVGSAVLRGVPLAVRALLLAGSIVHVGKAAVFGHGRMEVEGASHL
jgi:hypothetical protein